MSDRADDRMTRRLYPHYGEERATADWLVRLRVGLPVEFPWRTELHAVRLSEAHQGDHEMSDRSRTAPLHQEDLDKRFRYHAPKNGQADRYVLIRDKAKELADLINDECPKSREASTAFTKLEEAVMWANASIARNE